MSQLHFRPRLGSFSAVLARTTKKFTGRGARRHSRKPFLAFGLALLLESVIMQLATTAGNSQILTPANQPTLANATAATGQIGSEIQPSTQPTSQPTSTPTPKPTSHFPQLVQPVLAAAPTQPLINPNLIYRYPVSGYTLTQKFSAYHQAIDLATRYGTPIMSTAEGVVSETGYLIQGGGLMVRVDHGSGYNSLYAHLSSITAKPGQKVNNSVQIGRVGSTGWSTGPHLHFMITRNGAPLNPLSVLK